MEEKGKKRQTQEVEQTSLNPVNAGDFLLSQLHSSDVDIGLLIDGWGGGCNMGLKCVWRHRKKRKIPSIRVANARKLVSHTSCTS